MVDLFGAKHPELSAFITDSQTAVIGQSAGGRQKLLAFSCLDADRASGFSDSQLPPPFQDGLGSTAAVFPPDLHTFHHAGRQLQQVEGPFAFNA